MSGHDPRVAAWCGRMDGLTFTGGVGCDQCRLLADVYEAGFEAVRERLEPLVAAAGVVVRRMLDDASVSERNCVMACRERLHVGACAKCNDAIDLRRRAAPLRAALSALPPARPGNGEGEG